jgi:hypothetical protein
MTFREIALQEAPRLPAREKPLLRSLLENQSPIMKIWFVIMLLNLAMFLFITH